MASRYNMPGIDNQMGYSSPTWKQPTHTNQMPDFNFQNMYGAANNSNPVGGYDWNKIFGNVGQGADLASSLMGMYSWYFGMKEQDKMGKYYRMDSERKYADNRQDYENTLLDQYTGRAANAKSSGRDFPTESEWMSRRSLTGKLA